MNPIIYVAIYIHEFILNFLFIYGVIVFALYLCLAVWSNCQAGSVFGR